MLKAIQIIGQNHIRLEKVDSTNRYASDLLAGSVPLEGTVVSTQNQFEGKGQLNNSWLSEAGMNITLSVILYPTFLLPIEQFALNQAMSLAVCETIRHYLPADVTIKWSNDIYVADKKIAGLLIQNTISSAKIISSIIGIGINVNQTMFAAILPNPTSLRLEMNRVFEIEEVMRLLFEKIDLFYNQLRSRNFSFLQKNYLQRLYRLQKVSLFKNSKGERFEGKIINVSPIGRLMIQTDTGVEEFGFKEISFC